MATILSRYLKYPSLIVMVFAILYKYEVPRDSLTKDRTSWLITKVATIQQNRADVYKIVSNIDKYASVRIQSI
jgi:hypothetical protein